MVMKTCSKCHIEKDESEFWKSSQKKDGLCNACKKCMYKSHMAWYRKIGVKEMHKAIIGDKKICSTCKVAKPFSNFYKQNKREGLSSSCKECSKYNLRAWVKKNKNKAYDYGVKYRKENWDNILAAGRDYRKKTSKELSDYYIKILLRASGFNNESIKQSDLIDIKKTTLQIKRKIKQHGKENKKVNSKPT